MFLGNQETLKRTLGYERNIFHAATLSGHAGSGGATFLATPEAKAIIYGEPDCIDNLNNEECLHPNTVSLVSFGARGVTCLH